MNLRHGLAIFNVNCYEYFNLVVIISSEVFLSLFSTTENYGQL